jgi:acetyl-CoA carboxylase biotin carboxylase subunit
MFEKILIANRGEIAMRIIRACREMNIKTVAVYSKADANSMHVQVADEAICIGDGPSTDSYLRIDRLISAAEITDVDAIHPGYGFLSENAHFADVCESCNIRFIGPRSAAMNALHDKSSSRDLAKRAKVPTPPGSDGNRTRSPDGGQAHRLPGDDQSHRRRRRPRHAGRPQRYFSRQGLPHRPHRG